MDALIETFQAALSADPNIRIAGELKLRALEGTPGFTIGLLQLTNSPEHDFGTRQMAAIYFKNRVKNYWDLQEDAVQASGIEGRRILTIPSLDVRLGQAFRTKD